MTTHEQSAIIGWYRMCEDIKLVALLADISEVYAEIVINNYLKKIKQ